MHVNLTGKCGAHVHPTVQCGVQVYVTVERGGLLFDLTKNSFIGIPSAY